MIDGTTPYSGGEVCVATRAFQLVDGLLRTEMKEYNAHKSEFFVSKGE
jgi:hypothetical protein